MTTTKLSINALVLALSFGGLGIAATGCGAKSSETNPKAATEGHEKGSEASCGAGSCGAEKEGEKEKGSEASCGAGSCG